MSEQSTQHNPEIPRADSRCCYNCVHWRKKDYIHCLYSGPFGGDIQGDKNCTFESKRGSFSGVLSNFYAAKDITDGDTHRCEKCIELHAQCVFRAYGDGDVGLWYFQVFAPMDPETVSQVVYCPGCGEKLPKQRAKPPISGQKLASKPKRVCIEIPPNSARLVVLCSILPSGELCMQVEQANKYPTSYIGEAQEESE